MHTYKWYVEGNSAYIGEDGWASFYPKKQFGICGGYCGQFDYKRNPEVIGDNYEGM